MKDFGLVVKLPVFSAGGGFDFAMVVSTLLAGGLQQFQHFGVCGWVMLINVLSIFSCDFIGRPKNISFEVQGIKQLEKFEGAGMSFGETLQVAAVWEES
ncbi:hypothetical protein SUGI_0418080 [Cryptomeria japonica]|nr:hypothetical protein SUGI_0418080 [Cryptomeria japonica]